MSRPRLLDLFCGAGGAAMGYHRAGFEVVGVDIVDQPHYPFEFHRADAREVLADDEAIEELRVDALHASPPCQRYSAAARCWPSADPDRHPDLLEPTIRALKAFGLPWVAENVEGAPFPPGLYTVRLCGSSFELPIRRHRLFASSEMLYGLPCRHREHPALWGIYGASDGEHPLGFKHPGRNRGPHQATTARAREIMGMPWARRRQEIVEAIPPVYTEWIGSQLLSHVAEKVAS